MRIASRVAGCVVFIALFSGCACSLITQYRHEEGAHAIYGAGSPFTGTGRSLLLFSDGRWEEWRASCTEACLLAKGAYEREKNQIVLSSKRQPVEVLHIVTWKGQEFLATDRELRLFPAGDEVRLSFVLVKKKP